MTKDPPSQDGLPVPQRYWSVLAIWLAITLAVLDSAVVNVALPTISREFQIAPHEAIWIVNAYQIVIVVALLPMAALGEIFGYRRVYLVGLALFTAASLACALSESLTTLLVSRVFQGLGAAGIMAINAALVRFTYPQRLLGRAIGLNAMVVSLASAAGPSVAAAILSVATWPWLFAINIPVGIVTLALAAWALPHTETTARPFDYSGAALNALAFGLLIGGVDLATRSERSYLGIALALAGLGCFVLLALKGRNEANPILPMDLLRIPIFGLSVATSICSFCAQMLALVSLPFLFDHVMHRSPAEIGLLLTPWPIAVGIVGPFAGSLSDRVPAALLGSIGLLLFAAGLAALAWLPVDATFLDVAWRMALCGFGFGLFQAPNNRTMVASAPRARAGAAGGMLATARLSGQTGGATMVAILFALNPAGGGEHKALVVGAAIALLGALASASRLLTPRSDAV
ncbi:MFS transporter [Enterovirga rhinocerotis]|uniref:DHA2 family multidrug resistance protein-like MFS transporter n=1 Tax=Enterovirga rhinocerotis TaxID=1339210 RepID=A0A4R7CBR5_9HYPH|nr:MFS transporter [Enterovirga rhinocerotis]TDR94546.1 DHA2 family multidrug resistance protein-like MFS transporter [Enterovirga rhinocerotis]